MLLRDLSSTPTVRKVCVQRAVGEEMTPACALVFTGMAVDYYGSVVNLPNLDLAAVKELMIKVFAAGEFRCAVVKAMTTKDCSDTTAVLPASLVTFFQVADGTDTVMIEKLFALFQDMVDINDLVAEVAAHPDRQRIKELLVELDELLGHAELLLWKEPPPYAQASRRFVQASISLANRDYSSAALSIVAAVELFKSSLPKWASRFLPLVVDLAEAKSSSDVSAALERAAAPIGSWRLKRQKPLWSVTSLVGGMAGLDQPLDSSAMGGSSVKSGIAAGLMAPVGLQLSIPAGESSSVGLLVSILDVGQVTWSRLKKQEQSEDEAGIEQTPDADFAKVFSPGAYLTIGLANSPFTIGAGFSYAPSLRSYTYELDGTEREQDVSVMRFGVFAAVDVTLLPF